MPKKAKTYARYSGGGVYAFGVPACDLSKEQWDSLEKKYRDVALKVGTHTIVESKSAAKPKPEEPHEDSVGEIENG